jgi:hypothetical protein
MFCRVKLCCILLVLAPERRLQRIRQKYLSLLFLFQPRYVAAKQAHLVKNLSAPLDALKGKECI